MAKREAYKYPEGNDVPVSVYIKRLQGALNKFGDLPIRFYVEERDQYRPPGRMEAATDEGEKIIGVHL